jgi:arabinogalactan oligomer/maltooligosaccharide transport system substrate-binding protein
MNNVDYRQTSQTNIVSGNRGAMKGLCSWLCLLIAGMGLLAACSRSTPTPTATPVPVLVTPAVATTPQEPLITSGTPYAGPAASVTRLPASEPTPAATEAPTSGRIVVWHSWTGSEADALAQILERAARDYPNLTVDTLFVAYNDLLQSYADAVKAGGGPDVVLAPSWWLQDLVDAKVLLPLDDQVDTEAQSEYWPAAISNLRYQGNLYGLPTNFELVSLFYNRALVPPSRLPATTDELLALAQADPQMGAGLYANFYYLYWGIPAYGGRLMDDSGAAIFDQDDGTAAFLAWLKKANDTPGVFVDFDYGMLIDRFKKQEFAFFVDGPWAIAELQQALGDNLGVTLLPAGPAGPARPWLSADGIFFNPNMPAEQQQLSLLFARLLTDAESGTTLATTANLLPANVEADPGADPLRAGFIRQAQDADPEPHRREMDAVWQYAGDMVLKVLNGVSEPADAVSEAATLINETNGK